MKPQTPKPTPQPLKPVAVTPESKEQPEERHKLVIPKNQQLQRLW